MINAIKVYFDAGATAGRARRRGDESLARHQTEWARKAFHLEQGADRAKAQQAFNDGYRSTATPTLRD